MAPSALLQPHLPAPCPPPPRSELSHEAYEDRIMYAALAAHTGAPIASQFIQNWGSRRLRPTAARAGRTHRAGAHTFVSQASCRPPISALVRSHAQASAGCPASTASCCASACGVGTTPGLLDSPGTFTPLGRRGSGSLGLHSGATACRWPSNPVFELVGRRASADCRRCNALPPLGPPRLLRGTAYWGPTGTGG